MKVGRRKNNTLLKWKSVLSGGGGREAHDAGAEGRDDLHPPLQRRLQRRVEGGGACWWCSQVAFLIKIPDFLILSLFWAATKHP